MTGVGVARVIDNSAVEVVFDLAVIKAAVSTASIIIITHLIVQKQSVSTYRVAEPFRSIVPLRAVGAEDIVVNHVAGVALILKRAVEYAIRCLRVVSVGTGRTACIRDAGSASNVAGIAGPRTTVIAISTGCTIGRIDAGITVAGAYGTEVVVHRADQRRGGT